MTFLKSLIETFLENGIKAFQNQHDYKESISKNLASVY